MVGIVKSLDTALKANNLEKVAQTMDQVGVGWIRRVGAGLVGALIMGPAIWSGIHNGRGGVGVAAGWGWQGVGPEGRMV